MDEALQQNRKETIRGILGLAHGVKSLSERAVKRELPDLHRLALASYGSWHVALAHAGVEVHAKPVMHYNCATEILQSVRQLCYAGRCLKVKNVKRDHYPLYEAALMHFGSWLDALDAAGIDPAQVGNRPKWDRDRIIEAILQRAVERRALGTTTVRPLSLKTAAVNEFASWENALRAAGLDPCEHIGCRGYQCREDRKRQAWNPQLVIAAIRRRRVLGLPLDRNSVCRDNRTLATAARNYFGDWPSALKCAEIESTKALSGQAPSSGPR